MNTKDIKSPALTHSAAGPHQRPRVLIRVTTAGIVGLVTIAALAAGIPWAWYRLGHVVLSEATVKGTVTKIGARIEGRIKSIEVAAGQEVKKDDVLLRMEDSHLQAALARARAELQSAQKELSSEKMGVEQTRKRLSLDIERVNAMRKKSTGELDAATSNLEKLENNMTGSAR